MINTRCANSAPVLLVVEDNPEQRMLLGEFIPDVLACELHLVENTEAALVHARIRRPDLVLLDLQVPPHGGMEMLRALRSDAELLGVSVIVLSGSHRAEEVAAVEAEGGCRFIEKPYDLDVLEQAILDCLPKPVALQG
jgi:CheY-like chemotaxis protein